MYTSHQPGAHLQQVEQLRIEVRVVWQRIEEHVTDATHAVAVVKVRTFGVEQQRAVAVEEARARSGHVRRCRVLADLRRGLYIEVCTEVFVLRGLYRGFTLNTGRASTSSADQRWSTSLYPAPTPNM